MSYASTPTELPGGKATTKRSLKTWAIVTASAIALTTMIAGSSPAWAEYTTTTTTESEGALAAADEVAPEEAAEETAEVAEDPAATDGADAAADEAAAAEETTDAPVSGETPALPEEPIGPVEPALPEASADAATAATLSGKITNTVGLPWDRLTVILDGVDAGNSNWYYIESFDASGNYSQAGIAPGEYAVTAVVRSASGTGQYESMQYLLTGTNKATLTLSAGQSASKNFTLKNPTARFSGTMSAANVTNGQLFLTQPNIQSTSYISMGSAWSGTFSGGKATYQTPKLVPGQYQAQFLAWNSAGGETLVKWWDDNADLAESRFTLANNENRTGMDVVLKRSFTTTPTGLDFSSTVKRVGEPVKVSLRGSWSPAATTFKYVWYTYSTDDKSIVLSRSATYTPVAADLTRPVNVFISGESETHGPYTVGSFVEFVEGEFKTVPTPTISGTAKVGQTLTAKPGTWVPTAGKLSYQWLRGGTAISGATSSTYKIVAADAGKKLSVKVTGTKAGFTTKTSTSNETSAVATDPTDPPAPEEKPFPFKDVAEGSEFYTPINWMFQQGFAAKADKFNPTGSTTRGAMATMLMRIGEAESGKTYTPSASLKLPFTDVKKTDTHYRGIAWLWENGYAAKADKFNATNPMTRGAMATFLYRMENGAKDGVTKTGTYTDVPASYTHAKGIEWMAAKGYAASGGSVTKYRPAADVTRQAMATMLYRIYK